MLARREAIKRLGTGVGMLPLATVLADPNLTWAVAGGLRTLKAAVPSGKTVRAALAMPVRIPAPAIMLIHEWWGLNDQIKAVAADFAARGYAALAIDLMDGQVTTTPNQARAQMSKVGENPAAAVETCTLWADFLRTCKASTGKVGTCGWCFGGGWSLNAAIVTPVDATVVYYGRVNKSAAELAGLKGPVLGHFATRDRFIDKPMVDGFINSMAEAGKSLTVYWYEADHAFANPTSARYDEEDAATAWARTTSFLAQSLGLPA